MPLYISYSRLRQDLGGDPSMIINEVPFVHIMKVYDNHFGDKIIYHFAFN